MNKYRALVGFAGSILSMYAGEERELDDKVADEFVKIGYLIKIENLKSNTSNNEEKELKSDTPNTEEPKKNKKTKSEKKWGVF